MDEREIIARLPDRYDRYVEPFAGFNRVFLYKRPGAMAPDVYNIVQPEMQKFFLMMKHQGQPLLEALLFLQGRRNRQTAIDKTARWFHRYWMSKYQHLYNFEDTFKFMIQDVYMGMRRLQDAVILQEEFEACLLDPAITEDTVIYAAPPAVNAVGFYENKLFTIRQHSDLALILLNTPARVIVALHPHPSIQRLYEDSRWHIVEHAEAAGKVVLQNFEVPTGRIVAIAARGRQRTTLPLPIFGINEMSPAV